MSTQKLVVAMAWMAAACFGAEPKLTVVIFDYAETPGPTLRAAAETAREAFRMAGVETEWSICRVSKNPQEHCALPPAGTYVQAKVVPPALEGGPRTREALGYATKCPAAQRCATSYAFYRPVKTLAESSGREVWVALAFVMAHEVGHLLGMGHSPSGIMKAGLTRRDIQDAAAGRLRFIEGDARMLRAAVAEREMALPRGTETH
jgi:hypothetical protein